MAFMRTRGHTKPSINQPQLYPCLVFSLSRKPSLHRPLRLLGRLGSAWTMSIALRDHLVFLDPDSTTFSLVQSVLNHRDHSSGSPNLPSHRLPYRPVEVTLIFEDGTCTGRDASGIIPRMISNISFFSAAISIVTTRVTSIKSATRTGCSAKVRSWLRHRLCFGLPDLVVLGELMNADTTVRAIGATSVPSPKLFGQ